MLKFDELFDKSALPKVIKMAKTLSKEECRAVYGYMQQKKPQVILEFGVQYGCSTAVFIEMAKWLDIKLQLHSWDLADLVKCSDRKEFKLHIEDVTGKEEETILKYRPNMIFLDAHPYRLTKKLMLLCLKYKIDFLTHDVAVDIYKELGERTNNFQNKEEYGAWELYILRELFGDKVVTDNEFENEQVRIKMVRDKYGLSIVEVK